MFSLRQIHRIGLRLATIVVALSLAAWGEASNSVEQQFAAYHNLLSSAADDLLAGPAQEVVQSGENVVSVSMSANEALSLGNALGRVQQLRPLLEPILREQSVPADMAAVVLVESGGRPTALSPQGALGLWQLMPETARRYGLVVSPVKDERIDLNKATRAAARYLKDLYTQFGDWQLAFAAYNAGEQAVQRAMTRSGSNDFQRLESFLPNQTRAYVAAVMTARPLFGHGQNFSAKLRAARAAHVLYANAQLGN
ncbi:MAG: lytic transglycosylase domain-containing protein [Terriglobales bacterium]